MFFLDKPRNEICCVFDKVLNAPPRHPHHVFPQICLDQFVFCITSGRVIMNTEIITRKIRSQVDGV